MGNSISFYELAFGHLVARSEAGSNPAEPNNHLIHLNPPLRPFMDPHFLSLSQSPFRLYTIAIRNEQLLIDMLKLSTEISISYMK